LSADSPLTTKPNPCKGGAVLVLVLAACIYFAGSSGYPLLDPDEGRYAEIPREMLESGDWIIPRLNYVEYLEKPPLFYWCTAAAMALFGPHEWAVRTVPAVAGFLTVVLVMMFGSRLFGQRAGVMGGWVYLTSVIPLILARLPIIDGLFALLLTATWMTWWEGYQAPAGPRKARWFMASWACLGLAVMTKGIAAIALTGWIVFAFVVVRSDWHGLRSMCWIRGLLIFSAVVLPWHLTASLRHPDFFHFYIIVQHFGRLVSEEHARPFWYFLVILPFGMLFWTAIFFPAAVAALRRSRTVVRLPWVRTRDGATIRKAPRRPSDLSGGAKGEGALFLVIWVGAVVGLFTLSRSKLVPYILPAYPAMALLIAHYVTDGGLAKTSSRWCAGFTAIFLVSAIPVVSFYVGTQDMLPVSELKWPVRMAQSALFLGGILLAWAAYQRHLIPFATGLALVLLVPPMLMAIPVGANYRKVGGLMEGMPSPLPKDIRVAEWRTFDQGLSFYTKRRTILVDNTGELAFGSRREGNGAFFLKGAEVLRRLGKEGPLLVNIRPGDWPEVRGWGLFRLAAANSTNVMVGNEGFFRLSGLMPWPDDTDISPPVLLKPRPSDPKTNG